MRWTVWAAFAALCVLSGTSWVVPSDASALPKLEEQGLLFGLIGLVALLFAGRGSWSRINRSQWTRLAMAAVGFFGVPIAAVEYSRGGVPATSRSALFAMLP